MKPVNLLPSDAPVVKVSGAGPSLGMIGGVAASVVAVLAVVLLGLYFLRTKDPLS